MFVVVAPRATRDQRWESTWPPSWGNSSERVWQPETRGGQEKSADEGQADARVHVESFSRG